MVARFDGRVANTAGDSLLIVFPSAVEAVRFTLKAQQELNRRSRKAEPEQAIRFRAGINVGDVVEEGGDLLGDGVNIAARLEGLAEPGGILMSGATRDQVRDRLPIDLEDIGPTELKNINRPVRVFRVVTIGGKPAPAPSASIRGPAIRRVLVAACLAVAAAATAVWLFRGPLDFEPADRSNLAYRLPDKPSIAVLPFRDLSADAGNALLAESFSEDILTSLAKLSGLFVISSSTTQKLTGEEHTPARVAEALGVRYVLTGSFQRAEEQLRINAQLIDAIDGRYVWSEQFDKGIADLFVIKDEITLEIIANIGAKLELGERDRVRSRETDSLDAWLLQREGYQTIQNFNRKDNQIGRDLLQRAIDIDPGFSTAYANLALTYRLESQMHWVSNREEAMQAAFDLLNRALEIDPEHGPAMASLASWYLVRGDVVAAHETATAAVPLEPSDYFVHAINGWAMMHVGQTGRAVDELELSLRLSPYGPDWVLYKLSEAHLVDGNPKAAADVAARLLARPPSSQSNRNLAHIMQALALAELGQEAEARRAAALAAEAFPQRTVTVWARQRPYADTDTQARWSEVLTSLGMP